MDLENKVSLVTGGGQGIGEGIAKVLASHGSKVMIVDLNSKSADKVAKEINSLYPNSAAFFEADLTDSKAIHSMIDTTWAVALSGDINTLLISLSWTASMKSLYLMVFFALSELGLSKTEVPITMTVITAIT